MEWQYTLKCVCDMIKTSVKSTIQINTGNTFQSLKRPVWLNCWVLVYKLSGCRFTSCCTHLNFRYCTCFDQGGPWHSGNYRVCIHCEMHTWHDKNIQAINSHQKILTKKSPMVKNPESIYKEILTLITLQEMGRKKNKLSRTSIQRRFLLNILVP